MIARRSAASWRRSEPSVGSWRRQSHTSRRHPDGFGFDEGNGLNAGHRPSWPPIPETVLDAGADFANYRLFPKACLINVYSPSARMGLHQERMRRILTASRGDQPSVETGGGGVFTSLVVDALEGGAANILGA